MKVLADFDFNYTESIRLRLPNLTNAQMIALSLTTAHKGYQIFNTSFGKVFYWNGSVWKNDTYYPTLPSNYYIVDAINYNNAEHKYQTIQDAIAAAGSFTEPLTIEVMESPNNYADLTIENDNITLILNSGAKINNLVVNANDIQLLGNGTINILTQNANIARLTVKDLKIGDFYISGIGVYGFLKPDNDTMPNITIYNTAGFVYLDLIRANLTINTAYNVWINANIINSLTINHDNSYKELFINSDWVGSPTITNGAVNLNAKYINEKISITNDGVYPVVISNASFILRIDINADTTNVRLKQCVIKNDSGSAIIMYENTTVITDNCTLCGLTYSIEGTTNSTVKNYGSVANRTTNNVYIRIENLLIDADVE